MNEQSYRQFILEYLTDFCYVTALDIFLMYEHLNPDTEKEYPHLKVVLSQMKKQGLLDCKRVNYTGQDFPMGDMPVKWMHGPTTIYKLYSNAHEPELHAFTPFMFRKIKHRRVKNHSTKQYYKTMENV